MFSLLSITGPNGLTPNSGCRCASVLDGIAPSNVLLTGSVLSILTRLLSVSSSSSFLAEGKRLACTTACSAIAFSEESCVVGSLASLDIVDDNPVLVSEETLLDGDKTVPLGSVNKSDELVPILPSCSDDDSFDAPLVTLDCSIAVDVNAFCG